jgi:hypothetical protein
MAILTYNINVLVCIPSVIRSRIKSIQCGTLWFRIPRLHNQLLTSQEEIFPIGQTHTLFICFYLYLETIHGANNCITSVQNILTLGRSRYFSRINIKSKLLKLIRITFDQGDNICFSLNMDFCSVTVTESRSQGWEEYPTYNKNKKS